MAVKKAKTKKKTATTKATPAEKKLVAIKDKYTKTAILSEIAVNTNLTKKQVGNVLNELSDLINRHIRKRAVG